MNKIQVALTLSVLLVVNAETLAENGWSNSDYELYAGDFNGDDFSDLLYVARDARRVNGIALGDGSGFNVPLQSWGNAHLGISWSSGDYNVVVADFDADGRDDVFLQRRYAGNSYLLLTDDGGIRAIAQALAQDAAGIDWSAKSHRIVAGDFNGDGRSDLFLQPTQVAGLSAVVLADERGQFTSDKPAQSWSAGFAGFNWSTSQTLVLAADFDGNGRDDILLQAKQLAGTGPNTRIQATFPPNSNGVVLAQDDGYIFVTEGVQAWSEDGFGAQWSPLRNIPVIGDFNGDKRSDVLLQGLRRTDPSYLLYGKSRGPIFGPSLALDARTMPAADQTRLVIGRFTSVMSDALYFQARDPSTDNTIGDINGARIAVSTQGLSLATAADVPAAVQDSGIGIQPLGSGSMSVAALSVTSAGRTPGEFAVSALGSAIYQIPIWTPPGARDIEPKLALVYTSGGADGPLGPGWSLSGFSSIARCGKSYASSAGSPAPIALTTADDICIDGSRLRRTSGTQLVSGSVYQSEIANFSRVTAYGVAGNGPAYFVVEGKEGVSYEYGNTADSKAFAGTGTTPYAWMLNKVRDRQGNNLTVTYSTTNGDLQPSGIQYTQTPTTSSTYPYSVTFSYQNRVTNLSKYVAGGNIQQTKVLSKIDVKSSGVSVRQYNLSYESAPTTIRDRLASVQECGGSIGDDCLRPTTITYQNGIAGVPNPTTSTGSGATSGRVNTVDMDGDGRSDLVYATLSGANYTWWIRLATGSGFASAINTGVVTIATDPVLFEDFDGNGRVDLLAPSGGIWFVLRWTGSSFTWISTGRAIDAGRPPNANWDFVPADVNGDGLPDLVSYQPSGQKINTRLNTSAGGAVSFSATLTLAYTNGRPVLALYGNNSIPQSSVRRFDGNGDGRDDVIIRFLGTWPNLDLITMQLYSQGSTFVNGDGTIYGGTPLPVRWNDDSCTDWVIGGAVRIAGCGFGFATTIAGSGSLAMDWDGDGRTDLLGDSGGTLQVYRSLGTTIALPVSTGIPAGSGSWNAFDPNGDGLDDLAFVNASAGNAISFGLHNGAAAPADLATTIADGWGISASPVYTPISQNNYTKYSDATFPDMDYQAPLYVVSQSQQSDGRGGTFTNSYWYYGARVNRQGRGFEGFYATRSQDNRNNLYRYTYYRRDYPYIGRVFQDDVFQSDGTSLISRTVNSYNVIDLAGAGCTSAISATNRCFPFVERETVTAREISVGAPLVQTAVTDYVYDTFGNATSITNSTTDNDPASPFYNSVWQSVVTNTYVNDTTNWCLGKPTTTTSQNTAPGLPSATRRVDHTVDAVACRFTTETVEPLSTTLKVTTTFGFDTCGNDSSVSVVGLDKNGVSMPARVTSSNYGTRCQFPESITNPLGEVKNLSYDYRYGQKASITDPNGAQVSWAYDNFARQTTEARPDLTSTTWAYSDCVAASCWGVADLRLLVTETPRDTGGATVRTLQKFYDGFERLRFDEGNRVLGVWTNVQIIYNSLGLKQYVYKPYSSASNGYHLYAYDILNRPTTDTLYNSSGTVDRVTSMAHVGLKTTLTDAKGYVTQKWTDVTGKLRRIVDPSPGGQTDYVYDAFGNLLQMTDALGVTTSNAYNIRGFKTSSNDPDTGTWTYTPNSLNEMVTQTDNKGQATSYNYDKLGRLISRLEVESPTPTTFTYGTSAALHEIGRLKAVSKPDGYTEAYTFDTIGRTASATYTLDTSYQVNYTYNSIGAVDTITYPTSTSGYRLALKYLYSYGFVQQTKDNAAGTIFWSLGSANDESSPVAETLGNGVTVTSGYTSWTNDIVSRQVGSGGSPSNLQNLTYQWDLNGNLQQRRDVTQNLTEVMGYDSLNRLNAVTLNSVPTLSVGYDAAGNITSKSDVGGYNYTTAQSGCSYTGLPSQPHAVRNAGGVVYCYDKNGNMISRGGSSISWYSYNQPNVIAAGTNSTQFNYSANLQRWKQVAVDAGSTTTTFYVGGILEKVVRPTGVTEYRHTIQAGSGTALYTRRSDLSSSTYYVTTDHIGSGDLVLNSAGAVMARESFTPFGERRGSNWQGSPSAADKTVFGNTTRRGFTGHETLDAVGLVNMNGRVYDPRIGRFLSADPILQTISLSQALNPFSYVMNNPLTMIDPSGYSWLSKLFRSIGNFIKKYWRPILALVVAVVSFGYLAPIASQWFAVSVCLAPGTITISGAIFAGAISGALAGGIVGGWRGALAGLITGGILGGLSAAYGTTWTLGRVAGEGIAGGIGAEIQGGRFIDGFKIAALFSTVQWGAYKMRAAMIKQSCSGAANLNCTGKSAGAFGDNVKLGGGRAPDGATSWIGVEPSPLGFNQGGEGGIGWKGFSFKYKPDSFWDHLVESYAGSHDFLSSFRYMSNGNLKAWGSFSRFAYNVYSGLAVLPATPFAVATAAPSYAFVSSYPYER